MNRTELIEILSKDCELDEMSNSSILDGLNIVEKYIPGSEICAEYDIIYSENIDKIVEAGITKEDAEELRKQNWMHDQECDCLATFT